MGSNFCGNASIRENSENLYPRNFRLVRYVSLDLKKRFNDTCVCIVIELHLVLFSM